MLSFFNSQNRTVKLSTPPSYIVSPFFLYHLFSRFGWHCFAVLLHFSFIVFFSTNQPLSPCNTTKKTNGPCTISTKKPRVQNYCRTACCGAIYLFYILKIWIISHDKQWYYFPIASEQINPNHYD